MTLCAAWVRHGQNDEGKELVFATDSRLDSGTDLWNSGVKLFDLGRSDCLICFAGSTLRAYPLLLQGGNSGKSNIEWNDPRLDLQDVLKGLCDLFTELCGSISREVPTADILVGTDSVEFLLGGWSWRAGKFCIWKVYYDADARGFSHQAIHDTDSERIYTFLGDEIGRAEELLTEEVRQNMTLTGSILDMEPLRVLTRIANDPDLAYRSIDGPLQIAKVYRSGHNEFFGILWPSSDGAPTFLGRNINLYEAPPVRLFDPDTMGFTEALPYQFADLHNYDFGPEQDFVNECYSGPDRTLISPLKSAYQTRLQRLFKDTAYREFVAVRGRRPQADDSEMRGVTEEALVIETEVIEILDQTGQTEGGHHD